MYKRAKIILIILLLFISAPLCIASAKQSEIIRDTSALSVKFNFRINEYNLDMNYSTNSYQLVRLDSLLKSDGSSSLDIDSVHITASSSVDGSSAKNNELAKKRANSIKYLLLDRYSIIKSDLISLRTAPESWQEFRELLLNDINLPYRDEVLSIVDRQKLSIAARKWLLKSMYDGKVWHYLAEHIFPKMRYGVSVVAYNQVDSVESISIVEEIVEPVIEINQTVEINRQSRRPIFAIKTNLLYDAIAAPNIELEVPIGDRWSVAAEWIFPWWSSRSTSSTSNRNYYQLLGGNLEAKYWLGSRVEMEQLAGWFVGLSAGAGYYDLERDRKGYQGEFWHTSIGGGYAHTINRSGSLRMEYSLALGYLHSDYTYYEDCYNQMWYPVRKRGGTLDWVGPTRARVALVWYMNCNKNGRDR